MRIFSFQTKSKKIGEDSDDESSALAAAKTEKIKKMKVLKIKMDGATKAMRDAGAKKIIYDDDGKKFFLFYVQYSVCGVCVCVRCVCVVCVELLIIILMSVRGIVAQQNISWRKSVDFVCKDCDKCYAVTDC